MGRYDAGQRKISSKKAKKTGNGSKGRCKSTKSGSNNMSNGGKRWQRKLQKSTSSSNRQLKDRRKQGRNATLVVKRLFVNQWIVIYPLKLYLLTSVGCGCSLDSQFCQKMHDINDHHQSPEQAQPNWAVEEQAAKPLVKQEEMQGIRSSNTLRQQYNRK